MKWTEPSDYKAMKLYATDKVNGIEILQEPLALSAEILLMRQAKDEELF